MLTPKFGPPYKGAKKVILAKYLATSSHLTANHIQEWIFHHTTAMASFYALQKIVKL